ncbi:LytTR family transcriptional regulator [Erythrobacter sp. KY5]|uniref:LytTR family DNA-binding domain-containing protein n=1 Tax=Erythrobacter sp. KY5 TaxID=2011159 RepID=UPI000DBF282C|nr:LytTR family DNA-binding domain-containing protein [Erythrobacter sp. KY5]AWW75846.1 LytTR family transcriptional regulator [Erythrobacter sp. KY5]
MAQASREQSTGTDMGRGRLFLRKTLSDLAIMAVIGVFLAVIGPFGSIDQPLAVRLISWLAFAFAGYAIYSPMGFFVDRAHRALDLPIAPLWFVGVLIATVPMAALVYIVQFMPDWPPMPPLEEALTTYSYVFVIGGAVTLLFNVLGARSREEPPKPKDRIEEVVVGGSAEVRSATSEASRAENPLLDQLSPELGSDVIALEMEDHYVRVHTPLGSELVLMRLRDAMVHVAHIEGRQVHRSWWVARLAVEDVKREGRNVRLVLETGIEAPVARAQVSELKAASWI